MFARRTLTTAIKADKAFGGILLWNSLMQIECSISIIVFSVETCRIRLMFAFSCDARKMFYNNFPYRG